MALIKFRDNAGVVHEVLALRGEPGKSAFQIAQDLGYEGTEQEWLDSLLDKLVDRIVPTVGEETGTWIVDGEDTGVVADASAYTSLSEEDLMYLFDTGSFPETNN